MTRFNDIAAIAIGRNEGERLVACLTSLRDQVDVVIYVDSGSTDGSVEVARGIGAHVVALDMTVPFTAARARNAGRDYLMQIHQTPPFIQFLDGDCTLQPGWLQAARSFLETHPKCAVVCGRRREMFPEASIYNTLIDAEWDGPSGRIKSCGGDALMRAAAFDEVGGFDPGLIAGEEPELCVRLRAKDWEIWRLDAEMTRHDAALQRFGQWWKRSKRGGFAYAQGFAMHGGAPEYHKRDALFRALSWGILLPVVTLVGVVFSPFALLLLLAWPLQMLRLKLKGQPGIQAIFLPLAKLPEAQGALSYYLGKVLRSKQTLIEYK